MSSLKAFNFADGYITQSHFVNAYYGRKNCKDIDPLTNQKTNQKTTRNEIMDILRRVRNDADRVKDSRHSQKNLEYYYDLFGTGYDCIIKKVHD